MEFTYENLDMSLIGLSKEIKKVGVIRKTRGFNCIEFPEPVRIKITNPSDRYMNIPDRKGNKILPFIETLWIMAGVNDFEMPGSYVKNLYNYSDDGKFGRATYGPRIRAYTGNDEDYKISDPASRNVYSGKTTVVDQLKFVIDSFKRDIETRQAIIEIGDPAKDSFSNNGTLKVTKDFPCTRLLNFQMRGGKLDLTVYIRSNDLIFGWSAVNMTNFTIIQEIVANIIGVEIGDYYHIANNLHYYENHQRLIDILSSNTLINKNENIFQYKDKIGELEDFDRFINMLFSYENDLRKEKISHKLVTQNDLINDWALVLYNYHTKNSEKFINPYLNRLYYA